MVVDGPHDSSDGRADTIEDREIGMLQVEVIVKSLIVTIVKKFVKGFVASANLRQFKRGTTPRLSLFSCAFLLPLLASVR